MFTATTLELTVIDYVLNGKIASPGSGDRPPPLPARRLRLLRKTADRPQPHTGP